MVWPALIAIIAAPAGCRSSERARPDDAGDGRHLSFARIGFDARGVSAPIRVKVPEGTRSLAVVVAGHRAALFGVAHLETADGVEHVALPRDVDLAAAMRSAYFDERSGEMPGALHQTIRLGLFTLVFPDRPGVALPAGDAVLRVATSNPDRLVDVQVILAARAGRAYLPVNIFSVSHEGAAPSGDPTRCRSSRRCARSWPAATSSCASSATCACARTTSPS